jgi:hypothetical protein
MNHNVYLPDDISERAKAAGLNLSGLLRAAVVDELDRQAVLAAASDGMAPLEVDIQDADGRQLRLRFTGKHIAGHVDLWIYLTEDGKVLLVGEEDYQAFDDVEEFSDFVADETRGSYGREHEDTLAEAVAELGGRRVINL